MHAYIRAELVKVRNEKMRQSVQLSSKAMGWISFTEIYHDYHNCPGVCQFEQAVIVK